jgi:type II secretory pathway component PulK
MIMEATVNFYNRLHRGSILILSLWVLSFLSLLVFFSGVYTKQQILALGKIEQRKKAYRLAKSGALQAIAIVDYQSRYDKTEADTLNDFWANSPHFFKEINFKDGVVQIQHENSLSSATMEEKYGFIDEESKININYAGLDVLGNLLVIAGGMENEEAYTLASYIIDWRDLDDRQFRSEVLSEASGYLGGGYKYTPKNNLFSNIEEILLVRGVSKKLFFKIKDYITVFTDGKININTSSREVLLALGINESLVDKIIYYRSGANTVAGDGDDKNFGSVETVVGDLGKYIDLTSQEEENFNDILRKGFFTCTSDFFSGVSISRMDNTELSCRIKFVFDREQNIYYWSTNL